MSKILSFVLVCVMLVSFSSTAFSKDLKIGYVDVFEIFNEYEKTKEYDEELEKRKSEVEKQLDKKKEEIEKLQGKLSLLKDKQKEKEGEKISKKMQEYRDLERKAFIDIKKERDESMQDIVEDIDKIVADYAKANGFDLIINENIVLYGAKVMDITDKILKISNKKYKKK